MTCVSCHREIEAESAYCRFCGAAVKDAAGSRRLVRLPAEGKVAGVCAGLASYFDADITVVRLVWVTLSIVPGVLVGGLIAYIAAWALLPAAAPHEYRRLSTGLTRSERDKQIAGVCGGLAEHFGVDSTIVRLAAVILAIYPGAVVGGVLVYVAAWLIMPSGPHDMAVASPTVT